MAKIFIAEDDDNLLEILCDWFKRQKHHVDSASSGLEASELLKFEDYDVIIMDRHLPEMDGVDIIGELRAAGKSTPIIMLSGSDSNEEVREGLSAGATEYMIKPFQIKDLSDRLNHCLAPKS